LFLALGAIGVVVPLLPTTIFWIIAVGCFTRSEPALARWLLRHRQAGPALRAWFEQGAISRSGKWAASGGLTLGWLTAALAFRDLGWTIGVGFGLAAVAAFLWSRPAPTYPPSDPAPEPDETCAG